MERLEQLERLKQLPTELEHISAVSEKEEQANSTIESFYSSTFNPAAAKEVPALKLNREPENPLDADIEGF